MTGWVAVPSLIVPRGASEFTTKIGSNPSAFILHCVPNSLSFPRRLL
jgi:hypothetical protein